VPPGAYKIVLSVNGKDYVQSIRVLGDPNAPGDILAEPQEDDDDQ
jgi:hypothetical protein